MPTVLDESALYEEHSAPAADQLRKVTAAVRLAFTWLGVRKTLTPEQRARAADAFGAEGDFLSAAKKLLDTSHPAFRAVTSVKHQTVAYWRGISLPYPDPGIRLIRQDDIETFNVRLTNLKSELAEAVKALEGHYAELKAAARERLGRLYNPSDYPESLQSWFAVSWDFPSVEPPDYLRRLNPALYEEESRRVAARFEEAVQLAEQAFLEELAELVSHLGERLTGGEDGKPKVFRDSALENVTEFFRRFRHLNIRSSEELDDLVGQVQRIVRGVKPQQLRDDGSLRENVAGRLASVQPLLDSLLIDRPRRRLLRNPK
jgi:hypothetical protein